MKILPKPNFEQTNERNNVVQLEKSDLELALKEVNNFPRTNSECKGLTRVMFEDEHDSFEMLLQPNNLGFNVSCRLNGRVSYQLNGQLFAPDVMIGAVMLKAASAPAGTDIATFFG